MKKISKKALIASIVTPITLASIIPGIAISISKTIQENSIYNISNAKYDSILQFDGNYFNTQSALLDYANKITKYSYQTKQENLKYNVKNGTDVKQIESKADLDDFFKKRIVSHTVNSSIKPEVDPSGKINIDDVKFMKDATDKTMIKIYRGKNNAIYKTKDEAKDSYFEVHDVYFYKDTYFQSKDHLRNYLKDTKTEWWENSVPQSIVLRAPNGQVSDLIQIDELKKLNKPTYRDGEQVDTDLAKRIKNFIRVNAINNMEYAKTETNKLWYYKDTISKFSSDYEPNYIYVSSNGGKANYIVDAYDTDNIGINGPYFASTSGSIANITDKSLWQTTTNADRLDTSQYDNVQILSQFLDTVLNMSSAPNSGANANEFFKVDGDDSLQNEIDNYYKTLAEEEPQVYQSIYQTYYQMKEGKRYNSFYKIPILFLKTLDQIVYWKASQKIADKTKYIFSKICDHYDTNLNKLVPSVLMWNKVGSEKKQFSLKDIFHINDGKNLDLNLDPESIISKVIDDYPEMIKVAKTVPIFIGIRNNLGSGVDNFKFSVDYFNKSYDLNLEKKYEFAYEQLWKACSTNNKMQLLEANAFMYAGKEDLSDWSYEHALMPISDFYYQNFCDQWVKTIIMDEAIRWSLTRDRFIYSNDQLEYLEYLDFMKKPIGADDADLSNYFKWESNINYMKELYEKNGRQIENIFYIIFSIYNNRSYNNRNGKTLEEMFGPVQTYDNKEYSQKIFSKFQDEIMSDIELLNTCSNDVFSIPISQITTLAEQYGFVSVSEKEIEIDENRDESMQLINYPKNLPSAKKDNSRIIQSYSDSMKENIDEKYLETIEKEPNGKPSIYITKNLSTYDVDKVPDKSRFLKVTNSLNHSEKEDYTIGGLRRILTGKNSKRQLQLYMNHMLNENSDSYKDLDSFSEYLTGSKGILRKNMEESLKDLKELADKVGVDDPRYIKAVENANECFSKNKLLQHDYVLATQLKNEAIIRDAQFKELKNEINKINKDKEKSDKAMEVIDKEHQEKIKEISKNEDLDIKENHDWFEEEKKKIEEDYNKKINDLKKQLDDDTKKYNDKKKKNDEDLASNKKQLEGAKKDLNDAKTEKTNLSANINKNRDDIDELKRRVEQNSNSIVALEGKNAEIEGQLQALRNDVNSNSAKITELEEYKTENDKKILELNTKNNENSTKIKNLEDSNKALNTRIEQNKTSIDNHEGRIKALEEKHIEDLKNKDLMEKEFEGTLTSAEKKQIEATRNKNQLKQKAQEKYEKKKQKITDNYEGQKQTDKLKKLKKKFLVDPESQQEEIDVQKLLKKQKIAGIFKKVGQAIGGIMAAVGAIFFILDMIASYKQTEQVSYTFANKDFKLTWDGGSRTTLLFGMIQGPTTGIDSMKMMDPIQIIRPNTITGYYYNGVLYNTENEIRNKQCNDLLSGDYSRDDVRSVYSFEKVLNEGTAPKYIDSDLDKLVDSIFNELVDSAKTQTWPSFVEIRDVALDKDGIYVVDKNKTEDENIENIVAKIKPSKIAYLPIFKTKEVNEDGEIKVVKTKEPISVDKEFKHNDGSIPAYEVPNKTYDHITGQYISKEKTNDYVMINWNEKENKDKKEDEIITQLRNAFFDRITVPVNNVYESDLLYKSYFSQFPQDNLINSYTLYEAHGAYNDTRYFLDKSIAENYLWGSYGIELVYTSTVVETYVFKNKYFNSKQDYLNWIFENVEVI